VTYLVTGGLGLLVARWMAEHGAKHVVLMGRRLIPESDATRDIEAFGATVTRIACDISDRKALMVRSIR
jgi:hypothetical protein